MPKPVCVGCRLFFKVKKTGTYVEEGMPRHDGTWTSYKLWSADLYECRGCGAQLLVGFGAHPIAEHYQNGYSVMRERLQPLCRVDDC